MGETYGIAAFRSRQQVLALEEALKREGVDVKVVTTPRDVALGCGLSVKFDLRDLKAVQRVISAKKPTHIVGVYSVESGGGRGKLKPISMYR